MLDPDIIQIGDKVRCIDKFRSGLKYKGIYTIAEFKYINGEIQGIYVTSIRSAVPWFYLKRFDLVESPFKVYQPSKRAINI